MFVALRKLPHKAVLNLAWPMILSNLSVPLLGLVDTAILGHLPDAVYLSAVALGASLMSIVLWSAGFLRMGTTSLVARAYGAKLQDQVDALLLRSLVLALILGLLIALMAKPLIAVCLYWMQPSAEIAPFTASYCHIRLLSAPVALANIALMGWFIGRQNTRIPLLILLFTNTTNAALDWLLVMQLGLNSNGAAIATVCADCSAFVLGLWLAVSQLQQPLGTWLANLRAPLSDYQELLQANRYLFVRTLCLLSVLLFFNAQGARMGDTVLAANAIIFQLLLITSYGLDGIAYASEALVGEAYGQGNKARLRQVITTSGLWSLVIAAALALVFWLLGPSLFHLFTDLPSLLASLQDYFVWVVVLPLVALWGFWLDGVFIGAGQLRTMQNAMLVCVGVIFFPLWWLTQGWGNHGLWLSFSVFSLSRGISLAFYLPKLTRQTI